MSIKDYLFFFSLVSNILFFCVSSILGYTFEGSESSSVYKIYMTLMGGAVIVLTWSDYLRGRLQTVPCFWCMLVGMPIYLLACYYWQTGCYILGRNVLQQYLLLMACFSYPACCAGIYIGHRGIKHFAKYLDVMMLVMTISFFMAIVATIAGKANVGGAGYQLMSYMGGFTFSVNICMLLWGDKYERFSLFRSKSWNVVAYLLLIVQLLACLISGGRGGFVLLAVGTSYMLFRSRKLTRLLTLGIFALLTTVAASSFMDTPLSNTLEKSTFRTFDYMRGDAENMKKVSGRSGVYEHALKIIKEDNYMGRGVFRSINEGYPHNFFLEVLEQGGILYLLFWLGIFYVLIRKVNFMIDSENAHIMIPLMFYPYIQLIFSGTYITCPLFWFVCCYVWTRTVLQRAM